MADLFDTSRIPDDDAHWDALAARVAENAIRDSVAGADRSSDRADGSPSVSGIDWFAHSRASWVAASLLLAAALVFMVLPVRTPPPATGGADLAAALAPSDDVGRALTLYDAPPTIGALLLPPSPANPR